MSKEASITSSIFENRILAGIDSNTNGFDSILISKTKLAECMELSLSTINKLMAEGLPHFKLGRAVRFRIAEVMVFLNKRRKP